MGNLQEIINRHEKKTIVFNHWSITKAGVLCDGYLKEVNVKEIKCPICGNTMEVKEISAFAKRTKDCCEPYADFTEKWDDDFYNKCRNHYVYSHMFHSEEYPTSLQCVHCSAELHINLATIQCTADVEDTYFSKTKEK